MGPFETKHQTLRLEVPDEVDKQYLQRGADREFIFEQLLKVYENSKHLLPEKEGGLSNTEATLFGGIGITLFFIAVVMLTIALVTSLGAFK